MSEARDIRHDMQSAVLSAWRHVGSSDLVVFELRRPDGGSFFDFHAGQYAELASWRQAQGTSPRAYSIASSPHDRRRLEFYAVRVGNDGHGAPVGGSFTSILWSLDVGDELLYAGPEGRFTLDRSGEPDVTLVATGTGLGPYMSMLRHARHLHRGGRRHGRRLTLLHGVSHARDLGYRQELERMAADRDFGFLYVPTVSRPDDDPEWGPELGRGRVNDLLRSLLDRPPAGTVEPRLPEHVGRRRLVERLLPDRAAVYLCGNPAMIRDCRSVLAASGFRTEGEASQVLTEDYW